MIRQHASSTTRITVNILMRWRPLILTAFIALTVLPSVHSRAQEKSDLATFRRLHDELREKMAEDLATATTYLDSQIEANPESEDLNVLRQSLASRLAAEENFKAANDQYSKLIDFQIKQLARPQNQFGLWMTIQSMQAVASESGNSDALETEINRAHEALTSKQAGFDVQLHPVSQLIVVKARMLADDDQDESATALVEAQLEKLEKINQSDQATDQTMQAYVAMLRSLTDDAQDNALWQDDSIERIQSVVNQAIEKFPESIQLQSSYAEIQLAKVTRWNQEDTEATNKLIDETMTKLEQFASKNPAVRATLKRIELRKMELSSVKPKESLVGKPAPDWDIDAWVNTIAMDRDDLKGKVVLLDFWAMWCGPCIATFPHLREWREEFGDEKFEIVGVTAYYNYQWDDEKKRASRSKEEVSSAEERQTIASFLDHHKLKHPVIVTPEGSKMSSLYGAAGIPHVVIIDQDGVVQLVKTGAGEKTAKAIHAKLKKLLTLEDEAPKD